MTEAVKMTDPARELVELCEALQAEVNNNETAEQHVAKHFGVSAWSIEFFEIIFTITQRIRIVEGIISDLDIDEDYKGEIVGHVNQISMAFSANSLRQAWSARAASSMGSQNLQPLKAIAGLVRQRVSYRKLDDAEILGVVEEVETLVEWLKDHQISENDFIRQALIEGLDRVSFRLRRLKWLGWGYALDSLREVIAAYMLLERGGASSNKNPDAAAVLKKVGQVIKSVYSKVGAAKEATDRADWLIRAYAAGSLVYQTGPSIRALIGN